MAKREIAATRAAADALAVIGAHVRLARHEKNWTAADLGARVGASARTITAIEKGSPGVAVGTVLSAASVVGVPSSVPATTSWLGFVGAGKNALR
ncbi:MAG TPA: helix-turn-helix transcriptional regulator [Aldersonia sp.]